MVSHKQQAGVDIGLCSHRKQNRVLIQKHTAMKYVTYEERFKEAAEAAKTRREYDDLVAAIMADLMKTEEGLYVIDKRWKSYGTWKVTVWLNTAEFGEELKRYVADNFRIITHDEERE